MFNGYEFSFNGESSYQYGLMLYDFGGKGQDDVSFGNTGSIVETRTNNRIQPLHFGVNYHEKPLEFELVFGSDHALDRFEMEDISFWLTGHQEYKWLSIDQPDMETIQFRCIITELKPLTDGWLPYAFQATVICDCPYAYGFPFERKYIIDGSTDILFRNESSVREFLKPTLHFQASGGLGELSIINHDDNNREFLITDIPSQGDVIIDNNNGIIQELSYGTNLYDQFNLNFFRLIHGDNNLSIRGNGTLTISGRFLYNVAG